MEISAQMKTIILDTSVVVKWFSAEEDGAEHVNKRRHQIREGLCSIIIHDLLSYELANALSTIQTLPLRMFRHQENLFSIVYGIYERKTLSFVQKK